MQDQDDPVEAGAGVVGAEVAAEAAGGAGGEDVTRERGRRDPPRALGSVALDQRVGDAGGRGEHERAVGHRAQGPRGVGMEKRLQDHDRQQQYDRGCEQRRAVIAGSVGHLDFFER